ncbi:MULTISPECIES: sulfite exporter TauE/SafE family protein [Tissierellales]|jgi:hypothetical protein|uniref:Probable membrane transporter protein n=1 Tax=Acidilutibacter cellobiosedens TaxID=2507161 RepID=A0A410QE44_9FIRM|nr:MULTISPECIES: sulfite exporter TauE/SafE family protein [Tissierellales]MBE6081365.1 sulfite exporter TauE/SafE family protein [Tissierellaceae bacterium]QAT62108.1 sulfite exporter TauE/SafE family protein [Acidilutibacter cellobiosedens]SCL84677.1 Sulfite exporter TauE/SafE [Sporanaerobacter sp. PP17-6a]
MKLFIIGLFSGIISGMGIGGGVILIPSLLIFTELTQQEAQGINLIVFIPVAIVALITHLKNKNIKYKLSLKIIGYGLIGAVLGSFIAGKINSKALSKYFSIFLLIIGIYELFSKTKKQ